MKQHLRTIVGGRTTTGQTQPAHKHLCPFNRDKEEGPRGKHWHWSGSARGFFHVVEAQDPEPDVSIHLSVQVDEDTGLKTTYVEDVSFRLTGGWFDVERMQRIVAKIAEEGTMITRKKITP